MREVLRTSLTRGGSLEYFATKVSVVILEWRIETRREVSIGNRGEEAVERGDETTATINLHFKNWTARRIKRRCSYGLITKLGVANVFQIQATARISDLEIRSENQLKP